MKLVNWRLDDLVNAKGGVRTPIAFRLPAPKAGASASSATFARAPLCYHPPPKCFPASPDTIPCPTTGRPLRVATIQDAAPAICPSCANHGAGGFVSFVGDLRMVYACPLCRQLVWLAGA